MFQIISHVLNSCVLNYESGCERKIRVKYLSHVHLGNTVHIYVNMNAKDHLSK